MKRSWPRARCGCSTRPTPARGRSGCSGSASTTSAATTTSTSRPIGCRSKKDDDSTSSFVSLVSFALDRPMIDTWDPSQYDKFQREREQPFFDLLSLVHPGPDMRIVDLGCGTGA